MADSKPLVPVPNHPGIYTRGTRHVVRYRVRGAERKRAFRTLTEARRFKRRPTLARPSAALAGASYRTQRAGSTATAGARAAGWRSPRGPATRMRSGA